MKKWACKLLNRNGFWVRRYLALVDSSRVKTYLEPLRREKERDLYLRPVNWLEGKIGGSCC